MYVFIVGKPIQTTMGFDTAEEVQIDSILGLEVHHNLLTLIGYIIR